MSVLPAYTAYIKSLCQYYQPNLPIEKPIPIYIHTYIHTYIPKLSYKYTHTPTHTRTPTHTHIHTYTYKHLYLHVHTDIHTQLSDQLRCLDNRVETHDAMLMELQEFCKQKAAAEMEYSLRLDRIVKQTMSRHKTEKQRLCPCVHLIYSIDMLILIC